MRTTGRGRAPHRHDPDHRGRSRGVAICSSSCSRRGPSHSDGAGRRRRAGSGRARGGPARPHPRRLQSAERDGRPPARREAARDTSPGVPVIILTGDISTGTLRDIALQDCVQLNKPVKPKELMQVDPGPSADSRNPRRTAPVRFAEAASSSRCRPSSSSSTTTAMSRGDSRACSRKTAGRRGFCDCEAFLDAYRPGREACLLIDAYLPGMSGIELLQRLQERAIGCRPS